MNWIKDIFAFVVLGSLTGTCFSLVWFIVSERVKYHDAKLLYYCLKIVMCFYVLPVTLIVFTIYYKHTGLEYNFPASYERTLFEITPLFSIMIQTMVLVWFCLAVCFSIRQLCDIWKWHMTRRGNIPEEEEANEILFEEICQKLGIKNKVTLARNDTLTVPIISGLFRPVVMLPCIEYEKKELELIFIHELVHYKQKDLWVKMAAMFIGAIHCFNPLAWCLPKSITMWSEINCDIEVCKQIEGKYTKKEYYTFLLEQMVGNKPVSKYLASAVAEDGAMIIRRIEQMKKYKMKKELKKSTAAMWMAAFTVFSLGLAICVSGVTAKAQEKVYDLTREENSMNGKAEALNTATTTGLMQEVLPEDATVIEMPLEWNPSARNMSIPVHWYVNTDTYLKSDTFRLDAGDKVMVAMAFTPDDLYMKFGLVYPDGEMFYVGGRGTITYTFNIEIPGDYRFYMHNMDTVDYVEASGNVILVTDNYDEGDTLSVSEEPVQ